MKHFLIALASCSLVWNAAHAAKAPRITPLQVLESYTIPAVEISGMAWRTNPETKARELVIVGDREHKIYLIDWAKRKTAFSPREVDLKPLEAQGTSKTPTQSEWESVFSDESGRLFIIQENPAQILVVAADLSKIESRINLTVPATSKEATGWNQDENGKGEGLFPLKNGHILVVKEKNPLQIIEFAPQGKAAEGYRASLSLETSGLFPLPKTETQSIEFNPAFSWNFSPELESLLEDSSGLNADPKGALYLLGDQKNLIAKIGKTLKKDKAKLKVERLWSVPSVLQQPEGMVIDEQMRPIIATDRKNTKKPNLFLLSPMK